MQLVLVALIAVFSEASLAACLPVTRKSPYYHSSKVPAFIDFLENKFGPTAKSYSSIDSYYDSQVEVFMDEKLDNLCLRLVRGKVYEVPMTGVSITGGFSNSHNLNIKDLFEFLSFKSGRYAGYSYINYYRDTRGNFSRVDFIGYVIGYGPAVDIVISAHGR